MKGWHSVGTVKKKGTWEPADLGTNLKSELAKGATKKEGLGEVFRGLKS
jgi:hypothetical protein